MTAIRFAAICVAFAALALPGVGRRAVAQEVIPTPPAVGTPLPEATSSHFSNTYGRLDASRDAYQRSEPQRRSTIDRQLQFRSGAANYYRQPDNGVYPFGLDARYGHVSQRPVLDGLMRAYRYAVSAFPILEPWSHVPGDIYGYHYLPQVAQPLGHRVIRTGPNGYVYRPVYEPDLVPPQAPVPTLAPVEPDAAPQAPFPEPIPAPPAQPSRREF